MESIAPVLVLSTGRCGSTMISDVLNLHPDVLSLSEVFSLLGPRALFRNRLSGKAMWALCSRQNPALRVLLSADAIPSEILYPFDDPQARYTTRNVPPILCTMLPHLTPDYENLYDDLGPVVGGRPRADLAAQYRHLFEWLREHFERRVWVERSGGSLLSVPRLRRLFPEARLVHVYRDGRDTALSMRRHPAFQIMLATLDRLQRLGIRPLENTAEAGRIGSLLGLLFLKLVDPARMIRREFDLAAYGDLWSRMILRGRKLLAALPQDQVLDLRYEDVLERPQEKLGELIDFIDPSLANDAWLRGAARIPLPNPPRYLSLDLETRRRLTEACAPGLEALGYQTTP
ncbi:MAG: sulfotransferase [Candidatus Tectomicrobia bacterium]|nr:sulfotransferase [Candidatus Tectomicrobia bacterium]